MNSLKRTQLCDYLREYSVFSSIHGLKYLAENRSKFEKFLWLNIILVSLSGCIFMIFSVIEKYETSPIVLSFSSKDLPIYEIPFPAFTICPEVKYSSKLFNYSDAYFRILHNQTEKLNTTEKLIFSHLNLLCDDNWDEGPETLSNNIFETYAKLAPDIAIETYINNQFYETEKLFTPVITDQASQSQFAHFHQVNHSSENFHPDFGYSSSAGITTYPIRAFSGTEKSIEISLGYSLNDTDYICNGYNQGFRVLVHTSWMVPYLSNYYFRVPLDKVVVAVVEPELTQISKAVRKFQPEKRSCFLNGEKNLKYFRIYSQSNCFMECLANFTLLKCGCVEFFMPRDESTPICGSGTYNCTQDAKSELRTKDLEMRILNEQEGSFCDCKPSCVELDYRVETSQSEFYWREFFKSRRDVGLSQESLDVIRNENHWSVLSLYLKTEHLRTLERNELYGTTDLIASFGGLLGLFTGFSLISLAEIIYFCTVRICCNCKLYQNWLGK